jgi:hypothetical protein
MPGTWHFLRNDPHDSFSSNGHREKVVDVYYRIDVDPGAGTEDMVTVSWTNYTPDVVKALIDEAVANHQAVAGLSG